MVERMFVGEEKQSMERLKEEARVAKELQLTPVWPVKSESVSESASVSAISVHQVNGIKESSEDCISTAASTTTSTTTTTTTSTTAPRMTPKVVFLYIFFFSLFD